MSDNVIPAPKIPVLGPTMPVHVEEPAPLTTTPSTQPNAYGSIGVGGMGATVLMWLYNSRHPDAKMPDDVATSMAGLFIIAIHAAQHAVLAFLEWKRPKS